jgi:hypothetical protein
MRQSWQEWYLALIENADAKFTAAEPLELEAHDTAA